MNIMVNEEVVLLDGVTSVSGLLTQLEIEINNIAITVNHTIVPHSCWDEFEINSGDQISLFQAIAGG
ncbi:MULTISPECIES: sulfur carrier protein ThiS [Vibrio]|uniref:Sulfur carrier protein ThiS n=1 Tax=Vibrio algicola TaxID=2662262 RepID=A0A5Q0TB07_9VIBR|nr:MULTISPECIES: sulfur carrier protein ThiS [Vibrio]MBD1577282.1 sulfur carrier protein ThiS [Vibrio sp. S11_S32]